MPPFDFVLLDFDGLLVHTEPLHYAAYRQACALQGMPLTWDFATFCSHAHAEQGGFFKALRCEYPGRAISEKALYAEKQRCYLALLEGEAVPLMPGVEELLTYLREQNLPHAVVTNSPHPLVERVRAGQPWLQQIPLWLTREEYVQAKPSPEGYLEAIRLLSCEGKRGIGFEDTLKGVEALLRAGVTALLIAPNDYSGVAAATERGALHRTSLVGYVREIEALCGGGLSGAPSIASGKK
jgi:HAD superfamily hydrolase (TIGR01509 family)